MQCILFGHLQVYRKLYALINLLFNQNLLTMNEFAKIPLEFTLNVDAGLSEHDFDFLALALFYWKNSSPKFRMQAIPERGPDARFMQRVEDVIVLNSQLLIGTSLLEYVNGHLYEVMSPTHIVRTDYNKMKPEFALSLQHSYNERQFHNLGMVYTPVHQFKQIYWRQTDLLSTEYQTLVHQKMAYQFDPQIYQVDE